MIRVDVYKFWPNGDGEMTMLAGIGLFRGKLQCVEGSDRVAAATLLYRPLIDTKGTRITAQDEPEIWLDEIQQFDGVFGYVSEPYEDDDTSYDPQTGRKVGLGLLPTDDVLDKVFAVQ